MTPRPVATSVEELIEGASSREPMESADSKSGARFERVVIDGEQLVLKHIDRRDDWIMRQTGDLGCVPIVVWEAGVLDLVPDCIDHATVGVARVGPGGAVLMRDVSDSLVPEGDAPLPLGQHLQFLDHLAAFHAATWGWRDTVGLIPLANRYSFFGPEALACEAALGYPQPVPRIAADGWNQLARVAPRMADALAPIRVAPYRLFDALNTTPHAFLHGDWKLGNLGIDSRNNTVLVDWSVCGEGPPLAELAHYLALNCARLPSGHSKGDAIVAYREALERRGVDTASWWDRQLSLCLLGHMLLLGWEKALDATGTDRDWWEARTLAAIAQLNRTGRAVPG
ncbi:MAG: phosphotransferase [Acidimicrobiia bacterium]